MIRRFFKFLFRTFFWICAVVGFTVVAVIFVFYSLSSDFFGTSSKPLTQDSVLTLTLNGSYVEHREGKGFQALVLGKDVSLYDITRAIYSASQDPKIKGLLVRLGEPDLGIAQIQEIREALLAFKKTGKSSWCYTDSFGELSSGTGFYYLATACKEIWVQPLGAVNMTGLSIESLSAKEALEKVGVKPELVQKKEYKSFPEMFTCTTASEPCREAQQAIIDSILSQVVDGIATERKLSHDHVRDLISKGPYLTQEAYTVKLIDRIDFYQNLKPVIEEKLGSSLAFMGITPYLNTLPQKKKGDKIALIFGSGVIQRGKGSTSLGETTIGADATYKTFQAAVMDSDVKAIVYRINSEGGSPIAAETIYNIIQYAKHHAQKPVVISMSDAAASGGYWISLAGSKIVAHPGTLTGSIGVFSGKFVLTDLFKKLGITWTHVSTSENATMWSFNESYTPSQWGKLHAWTNQIYEAFTNRVAKDRKIAPLQVEKIARGRVWTGEQALALGLVDQLGGLQTALDLAKKEANLCDSVNIEVYPQHLTFFETLLSLFENDEEEFSFETSVLGTFFQALNQLRMVLVFLSSDTLLYPSLGKVH